MGWTGKSLQAEGKWRGGNANLKSGDFNRRECRKGMNGKSREEFWGGRLMPAGAKEKGIGEDGLSALCVLFCACHASLCGLCVFGTLFKLHVY